MKPRRREAADASSRGQFRTIILLFAGIICLMLLAGVATFLLSIEGAEETMVPDLMGQALEDAIIALQEKELNARVQMQYSSNPGDKGTVLSQDPDPGALVRAGSNVVMRISKGAIIDRVENYIGWKLEDLELHLQTLFTTHGPLLRIKRPVVKVFDESEPGTILEQKPLPGTEISGMTDLELVVSRGPEGSTVEMAQYVGMPYEQAIERLIVLEVPFTFTGRPVEGDEEPGRVVDQDPAPGTARNPGELVELVMTEPVDVPQGKVFGIFERSLPDYPIIVDLTLEAVAPEGEREEIVTIKHPGGMIGIPYTVEEGTMLVLSVFDREIIRHTVLPPEEPEEEEDNGNNDE